MPLRTLVLLQGVCLVVSIAACQGAAPTGDDAARGSAVVDPAGGGYGLTVVSYGADGGAGTITGPGDQISCGSGCFHRYPPGSVVTLTATAASPSSVFLGWSGPCAGAGSTCAVLMSQDRAVTATFGLAGAAHPVAVRAAPGLQVPADFERLVPLHELAVVADAGGRGRVVSSPARIDCGDACTAGFAAGSTVTLTAAGAAGTTFLGWGGPCQGTAPTCVLSMSEDRTVTASFEVDGATYPLSVTSFVPGAGRITSTPAGIDCGATCTASFPEGALVTLTAMVPPGPMVGVTFGGWSGDCAGTGPTCTVTMSQARSVHATFLVVEPLVELVVTKAGDGHGLVAGSGISCGSDCSEAFAPGSIVTLTALPADDGSAWAGWSGDCSGTSNTCVLSMTQVRAVTATFTFAGRHALTVTKSGGPGTVTSTPAGIDCGAACSAQFQHGTLVTLVARPGSEAGCTSVFGGWRGACAGTGPCVVSMTEAREVKADFPVACALAELRVTRGGTGAGRVTASGGLDCGSRCVAAYVPGTAVTVTAAADAGSRFTGWAGDCAGATPTCALLLDRPRAVTATFDTAPAGGCRVIYTQTSQWPGGFGAQLTIQNTGPAAWTSWTLQFTFPHPGQEITQLWNGTAAQEGTTVRVESLGYNGAIPAGGSYGGVGFNGAWSGANPPPTAFSVNGMPCE